MIIANYGNINVKLILKAFRMIYIWITAIIKIVSIKNIHLNIDKKNQMIL